jgi:hypothetical protein
LTVSPQPAEAHTLPEQMAVVQSAPVEQPLPTPHFVQEPPQSTSVSVLFFTVSLHVGAWHAPPVHTELAQSEGLPHRFPTPQ